MDSTRYLSQAELGALARASVIPMAQMLAEALDDDGVELVVLTQEVLPSQMHETYRIRLERYEIGEGPRTVGLREFVAFLAEGPRVASCFSFPAEAWTFLGFADDEAVIALTAVERIARPRDVRR